MKDFLIGLLIGCLLGGIIGAWGTAIYHKEIILKEPSPIQDSVVVKTTSPTFFLEDKPSIELLYEACDYYGLQHVDIVISQALLETGNFMSDLCIYEKNLFGLFNSRTQEFYSFNHWSESVKAYRDKIQYRYKEGNYYDWLENIGYAEDTLYIQKVRRVKKKFNL